MTKVKIYIFDDKWSYLHFFLGALTAFFMPFSIPFVAIYLIYQIAERERYVYKLGDVIEFLLGYYCADIIIHLHALKLIYHRLFN